MQSIRFGILDTETCNNQEASQNSVKFNLTEGSVKFNLTEEGSRAN